MIKIGLTGGIATGKSKISETFKSFNIPVIDADEIAKQEARPGSIGWAQICDAFGLSYLNEDDTLNRAKLSKYVFSNPKALKTLNNILHPLILRNANGWVEYYEKVNFPIIVFDAPLLIELNLHHDYDHVIVASCSEETQIERLIKRKGLTRASAMNILAAQMPTAEKIKHASLVIDTSGPIEYSVSQTTSFINNILSTIKSNQTEIL
jgi:dephospho-CoA kinase